MRTLKIFGGRSGSEVCLNSAGTEVKVHKEDPRLKFKRHFEWNIRWQQLSLSEASDIALSRDS